MRTRMSDVGRREKMKTGEKILQVDMIKYDMVLVFLLRMDRIKNITNF